MAAKTDILYLKYLKAVNDLSTKDTNIYSIWIISSPTITYFLSISI